MIDQEEVRKLAYRFYLRRNGQNGSELDDWLRAEKAINIKKGVFNFLRHPLFLLFISGFGVWLLQQQYLKSEKFLEKKYEIFKTIPSLHAKYYQEIWNQWFAFQQKTPSVEFRANIQAIVAEAKSVEVQLPILFKDKQIYKNWQEFLGIFWKANYPVSREGISEEELNKRLNAASSLIDDILNKMSKELK